MENVLLSVIIPVFNGERFIAQAIRNVLDQHFEPLEIVVVDDGSTDNTRAEVLRFGVQVRYAYQENQGPAAARNRGLELARGDFIGFLDCDDLWPEGRLDILFKKFLSAPALEVVMGHARVEPLADAGMVPPQLLEPHVVPLFGCGLFRRSVFEKVGLLDSALRFSEDQDWFLRLKEQGIPMVIVKEVTLIRRRHAHNMTEGAGWADVNIIKVLKKSLDRRRQNQEFAHDLPKLSDYKDGDGVEAE